MELFRATSCYPLDAPTGTAGGGIMDSIIKFPTVYMDDETAVNIVKHSLAYLESDELTFEAIFRGPESLP